MLRRLGRALAYFVLGLFLLIVLAFGLIQTAPGQRLVASGVERAISSPEARAEVRGIGGFVPVDMTLERLALEDAEGAWLEIEDVHLAWSPVALLGGRLRIEAVTAGRVEIARLPPPTGEPAAEPSEPIRMPELPEAVPLVTVDRLAVDEIVLGEAVLGERAVFRAEGRLATAAAGESIALRLDLERTDRATASAVLDATLDLAPPALDVRADLSETGGLLADLIGPPATGDFGLELTGSGPLADWRGELRARAGGLATADLAIRAAAADTARPRLAIEGGVAPMPGLLPTDFADLVGGSIDLDVALVRPAAQRLEIERLRVGAAAGTLSGEGRLDFEAAEIDLGARLEIPDLAPLGDLAATPLAGALTLEATAEGALTMPAGRVTLALEAPGVADVTAQRIETTLDWSALAPLTSALALRVSGEGGITGLELAAAPELAIEDVTWQLALDAPAAGDVTIETLRIEGGPLRLSAGGAIDRATLAGDVDVTLGVSDLAVLTAPYGQTIAGTAGLRADIAVAGAAETIDVVVTGDLNELGSLPPGAAELLGSRVTLEAAAEIAPDGAVRLSRLAVDGAAASLRGDAVIGLADQDLEGTATLTLPRLEALEPVAGQPLAGTLTIAAEIGGTVPSPTIALDARGRDLLLAGQAVDEVTLALTAEDLPVTPSGRVELRTTLSGLDAALSSAFHLENDSLALRDVELSAPGTRIGGNATVDLARTLIDGEFEGSVAEIGRFQPLLGVRARGELELSARLQPENGTQSVALALDAADLRSEFGNLRRLGAEATLADMFGAPAIDAGLSLGGFSSGDVDIARAEVQAGGTLSELSIEADAEGTALEPFALDAAAGVTLGEAPTVRLERLSGEFAGQPLELLQPATLATGETLRVEGLDLRYGGARLAADASLGGGTVDASARLEALPLALLSRFGVPPLQGRADATLQLSGAADDPNATLDLTVEDLQAFDPEFTDFPPARLDATARLAAGRLSTTLEASGVTEEPIEVALELPVVLALDPFAFSVPDGAIDGNLAARLQLARVAELAQLDGQRLEGELDASIAVGGTLTEPTIDGRIEVQNGLYENGDTGTVLRELTLVARADQSRLTIAELSATDGGQGRLRGEGAITLDPTNDFPFQLSLRMDRAHLVRRDDVDATLGGRLDLTGDAARATLEGRIDIVRAEVGIPEASGPTIPVLDVQEVGGDREVEAGTGGEAAGDEGGFVLELDLRVDIPGQVFVRGRGLESEWEGDLTITGTADQPRIAGFLAIKRGYFDFVDRRFELRRGRIEFGGGVPPEPFIDLEAAAEGGDITAIVRLSGPADDPELSLDSEPQLPQDEILSRLLFDREVSEISATEAASLALALNRLRGGGGFDALGTARDLLGVDTLDVGGGPGEEAVRAGKYLGDDVYVEVEKGRADQSGKARVEVEILPNVSVEADTGEDQTGGVGIKWKFDY